MNIHEYQAKSLLQKFGVAVPRGGVAYTPQEAEKVARELGGPVWVVKSQIHAGGRGAGHFKDNPNGKGGVRVAKSAEDVAKAAAEMLGQVLITKQTGPKRPRGQARLCRGRLRHQARALSRHAGRPRDLAHHHHGVDRRRHGDRGGRRARIPRRSSRWRSIRRPGMQRLPRAQARLRPRPRRQAGAARGQVHARHVPGLHRARCLDRRDQSAGRDRRGRGASRSTPR